jgi:hypothetical protein
MRKVITITILIFLTSCSSVLTSKDTFIGEWVISESSPSYSMIPDKQKLKDITITITKEDIFYKVSFGKEFEEIIMAYQQTELDKKAVENFFKYQLSPDKRFLISIDASNVIIYNEDSGTITTQFGWFKRK